jgi:hypothetical protein
MLLYYFHVSKYWLQKSQTGHKNGGGNHGQLTNAHKSIQFFPALVALRTDILGSDR